VLTFIGCLLLAVAIGLTRGDAAFQTHVLQSTPSVQQQINYVSQLITFMVIKN
jgi:hypothetical protein